MVNSYWLSVLTIDHTLTSYIGKIVSVNFCRAVAGVISLSCLAGCATQHVELPTLPNTESAASHRTQTVRSHPSPGTFDLLYITDRAPITAS
ncbi:hypothetical protein CN112_34445, partial [Sinorhizobium meliloti]